MEFAIGIVLAIVVGLLVFLMTRKSFSSELDSLEKNNTRLKTKLDGVEQGKVDLENLLKEEQTQTANLRGQLEGRDTEIDKLKGQLEGKDREIAKLTNQLETVSGDNENALRLLHLFELSLQLTAFALSRLYRAMSDTQKSYEELIKDYEECIKDYEEFREEVAQRTKRRLVRSGVGTALSLLPGIGVFQLVGDLTDLIDFVGKAGDAAEDIQDFGDGLSEVKASVNLMNFLEDLIDFYSIESLQPQTSTNQNREKVKQAYQSAFEKVFKQNLDQGGKDPNVSDLDNFLKEMIQLSEDLVKPMSKDERRQALNRIVTNFRQFGIHFHTYHESPETRVTRSLPAPKN